MKEACEVIQEALSNIRISDMLPDSKDKAISRASDMCRILESLIHLGIGGEIIQNLEELGEEDAQMAAAVIINLGKLLEPSVMACLIAAGHLPEGDKSDVQ